MKRKLPSLWSRVLLSYGMGILLPLVVAGSVAIWLTWTHTISDLRVKHITLARSLAWQVRESLRAHEVGLAHMAVLLRQAAMGESIPDSILLDHLGSLAAQGVSLEVCLLIDEKGSVTTSVPNRPEFLGLNLAASPEVRRARETGQTSYSHVQVPPFSSEPMISLALSLEASTAVGFVPLAPLNNILQRLGAGSSTELILTDERGVVISHKDPLVVAERVNASDIPPVAMGLDGIEGTLRYDLRGEKWLGAVVLLPEIGWPLAVGEREHHALGLLRSIATDFLVALVGGGILGVVLALVLASKIVGPINEFVKVFDRVSLGRLTEKLPPSPFDELEGMRVSFERMTRAIAERERSVAEAASQWSMTFNAAPDPIWLVDGEYRILRVNKAACLMVGLDEKELSGKPCYRLIHGTDRPPEACPHARTIRSRSMEESEQEVKGRYLLVSTAPIIGDSGEVLGVVHHAKDVIERKRMEDALRASEERYRLVVENAQDAILVFQDGLIKFVNPRAVELIGIPEEELKKRSFFDFIYPDDRDVVLNWDRRVLEGQRHLPVSYRFRITPAEGGIRWVEARVIPVSWDGRPATLYFLMDVTEKLEWEQALRESEERYRTLVEHSPDGFFMADIPSGSMRFVNTSICRMFGYSVDEALRMRFWDVLAKDERHRAEGLLVALMTGGNLAREPLTFRTYRKDGSSMLVEVRVALVKYRGQDMLQAVVRDVTEQTLLQQQLQHSQRMQALGTLAAGVAHEFNNILAAIQGFAQLLLYVLGEDGEGCGYVREIISSCDRAGSLTHSMLSLARVEATEKCPIKVNQVIESSQRFLAQTLPPSVRVELSLEGGLPFVNADPSQLEQVIMNLVLNARDAMPDGGVIRIGSRLVDLDMEVCKDYKYIQPGRFVEIYVEDEGVGIPQDLKERIFEPFFTTKQPGKGTGLGLSVSYSMIKAHGGYIIAESPPEGKTRGSILRVFLPPMEGGSAEGVSERRVPIGAMGHGERILVADDETRVREILKTFLEKRGYEVIAVGDGQEAVVAYLDALEKEHRFHLVVMDLAMPVRDGKWAIKEILDVDPKARIIIATGHTDEGFLEDEISKRVKGMLKKPFDLAVLSETIARMLGGDEGSSWAIDKIAH